MLIVTAPRNYNLRVVECRLAALLLHKALVASGAADSAQVRTLSDVQRAARNAPFNAMLAHVRSILHEGPYAVAEVASELGMTPEELVKQHMSAFRVDTSNGLALRDRALHVYAEAARVFAFRDVCSAAQGDALERLGQLMNDSQSDCRAHFNCSCAELDELTALCRAEGALGSRLTGAGWGGCTVSLVPEEKTAQFVESVRQKYYTGDRQHKAKIAIFATRPGNGAGILKL